MYELVKEEKLRQLQDLDLIASEVSALTYPC